MERLPEFARYSADRLREHSRILQPVGAVRATAGATCGSSGAPTGWGSGSRSSAPAPTRRSCSRRPGALLAGALAGPTTATVPRVVLALLGVAAHLDASVTEPLLELGADRTGLDRSVGVCRAAGRTPSARTG
ncbi:hypothetical protein [Frigoriglobus tundricola]|uniref:hypothetical protein n=1 Tax=Frigoriglobus tundricola TaxID=2774151 RepID=UPI00148EDD41|nr:hypothetical protein [Frigoriglobus tundricola]